MNFLLGKITINLWFFFRNLPYHYSRKNNYSSIWWFINSSWGTLFCHFYSNTKKISINLPPEVISWGVTSSGAILAILINLLLQVNLFSANGFVLIFLAGLTEALVILFMNKTIRITNMTYYAIMMMLVPAINGF